MNKKLLCLGLGCFNIPELKKKLVMIGVGSYYLSFSLNLSLVFNTYSYSSPLDTPWTTSSAKIWDSIEAIT